MPSQIVAPTSGICPPTSISWRSPMNLEAEFLNAVSLYIEESPPVETYDLRVYGFSSPTNVGPGAELTYTLFLKNFDKIAIDNIEIVSDGPFGFKVTRLALPDGFVSDVADNVVTFSGGALEPDAHAVFTIAGTVSQSANDIIENVVTVPKSVQTPVITIAVNIVPALGPDLRIFGFSVPEAVLGDTIVYTFAARNDGVAPATGVEVQNTLPSGLSVTSVTHEGGFISSGVPDVNNVLTFSGGILQPGEVAVLTITGVLLTATGSSISSVAAIDPNNLITEKTESNNIATIITQIMSEPVTGTVFVYPNLSSGGDTISDFKPGDKVDISGALEEIGYTGVDPISDGYVVIVPHPSSHGWLLQIDVDGEGTRGRARSFLSILGEYRLTSEDFIFRND